MWDQRYSERQLAYGDKPNDFLVEVAHHLPRGAAVLDVGAGQGRNGLWLAKRGHSVTLVDQSRVGLERAQSLAAEAQIDLEIRVTDLRSADFEPTAWDAIVSIWCHMPAADRVPLHRELATALRPGGILVFEAYAPGQVGRDTSGPMTADRCVSLADARREFAGLEVIVGREVEREVHEGRYHDGLSAVTQFVGHWPSG